MRANRWLQIASAAVAACLLIGLGVETLLRPDPVDAAPYHERVREVAKRIPHQFGPWKSQKIPLPRGAIELLEPNVALSRRYVNTRTMRYVDLLLVQTKEAGQLAGHYPPNCYPSNGQRMVNAEPGKWKIGGVPIRGMVYEFTNTTYRNASTIIVYNFLIVPDVGIVRDMATVREAASDYLRHFYGAAQVQVVFQKDMFPPERREEIFRKFIREILPLIKAILSGDAHESRVSGQPASAKRAG